MSKPWTPDGASSRALLIGVSDYKSPGLEQIPAVRNNLDALKDALSGERGLLPPGHIRVLGANGTPVDEALIGGELASARREAEDLLLIYYAGHGLLDDDGLLHLAVTDTDPDPGHAGYTALPFQLLKQELAQSRAKARVLVLDCCFSGRAVAAMSPQHTLLAGQLDLNGTYTLTSTTATAPSHAPPGAHHTAFTEALLSALTQPEAHTLDDIYQHIDQKLNSTGLPRPQARSVNAASNLVLTRGPVKTKPPTTHTPTPTHPPGPPEVRFSRNGTLRARIVPAIIGTALLLLSGLSAYGAYKHDLTILLFMVFLLPVALLSFWSAFSKRTYLEINDSGLKIGYHKTSPSEISWQHVSYVGILRHYTYEGKNKVIRAGNEQALLVIRLRQPATPPPGSTSLHAGPFRKISLSLQRIDHIGCEVANVEADPMWLREAIERLSGLPCKSDLELYALDPRLKPTAPSS
ncbi:caspase family protein [Streptomyces sp. NPDC087428]|uniref:caspase, EACC1-associated type n=1 Tax=Streptomyces sp. NPDC087428 TaxID=3365788 RepID=UPI0038187596